MMNFIKFSDYLNSELKLQKPDSTAPIVVDLFAGCGGLALGFEAVGFQTIGFEMVKDACETYTKNLHGECYCVRLSEETDLKITPDIVIGGLRVSHLVLAGFKWAIMIQEMDFPLFSRVLNDIDPK